MSNSVVTEWLDENSYRAYPLVAGVDATFTLSGKKFNLYDMVVDANIVYNQSPDNTYLEKIAVQSDVLYLYITGKTAFTFDLTGEFPIYSRHSDGSLITIHNNAQELLNTSGFATFTNITFEPCVVTETGGFAAGVSSLKINGNDLGTDISLNDGYQLVVIPVGQTLQLEAGRGYGEVLPCANYKDTDVTDCSRTVNSINGATSVNTGEGIAIKAGSHVLVYNDPSSNTVYIGMDFVAADIRNGSILPP